MVQHGHLQAVHWPVRLDVEYHFSHASNRDTGRDRLYCELETSSKLGAFDTLRELIPAC